MEAGEARRSRREDFEFLDKPLGRGSWGTVHLARRRQDGSHYAVKEVDLERRSRKDQLAAVHEAQLLASLSSPHIIKYYDSFLHEGKLYIVMEYAAGGSLHAAISRSARPLPEDSIWRVLLHTALALHHMHSRRMLHRDVKPLNIFITGPLEGQGPSAPAFKLGDVGVSKVLGEGRDHASTLIGTPYFLSPEMCQERPYDAKSDVWALGVTLYSCATRRHPFDAQSQPGLIMKILRGRYDPVLGLSSDLTAIIHRCLSQAAARRPTAERLLTLPAVRAKAGELRISLPPDLLAAAAVAAGPAPLPPFSPPPAASAGANAAPEGRSKGGPNARQAAASGRPPQPLSARGTPSCQGRPPLGAAVEPLAAAAQGRRQVMFTPVGMAGAGGASPAAAAPCTPARYRRHSANGERRKPPLPLAAVPQRRRTVQVAQAAAGAGAGAVAAGDGAAAPASHCADRPSSQQTVTPLPSAAAAAAPTPAAAPEIAAVEAAAEAAAAVQVAEPVCHEVKPGSPPPPRRRSWFSVQQHLPGITAATAAGQLQGPHHSLQCIGDAVAEAAVQRSAKSDSCLPRQVASLAEASSLAASLASLADAPCPPAGPGLQQEPACCAGASCCGGIAPAPDLAGLPVVARAATEVGEELQAAGSLLRPDVVLQAGMQSQPYLLHSTAGAAAAATAAETAEAEAVAAEAVAAEGVLHELRERCVAVLGSEALFLELHALAQAAVDGDGGEGSFGDGGGDGDAGTAADGNCGSGSADGGSSSPRPAAACGLAALSDALFERVGYSGRAAEALHLLLKMLYHDGGL